MTSTLNRVRPLATAVALLLLMTMALFVSTSWTSARAAEVLGAIKEVTLSPPGGDIDDEHRVDLKWCVPNGTKAGDTFSMTLPRELQVKVPGFPLNDPSGNRVADATIADKLVTFTLTSYAQTHNNVCGTAWFRSWYDQNFIEANTKTTLEFTTGGQVFRQDVTPTDSTSGLHLEDDAEKWGYWNDEAQTRAGWEIVTPSAVDGSWDGSKPIVITDDAPAGMEFDCQGIHVNVGHGWSFWGASSANYTLECSANRFKVTYTGAVAKDYYVYLWYSTKVTDPSLEKYTNTVGIELPGVTGPVTASDQVSRRDVRTAPAKSGNWENSNDQKAIKWMIRTPDAPAAGWSDGAKIEDHATAGLAFRCSSLRVQVITLGEGAEVLDPSTLGTCTADDLVLNYTDKLTEGQWLRVDIISDVTDRSLSAYDNTAQVTVNHVTSDVQANRVQRSDAGGDGNGDTPPASVSIGDFVWFDTNKDGIQDASEAPVADVTVKLLNATGDVVGTTTTNADGFYSFTDLTPSTDYQVQFVAPTGHEFTIKGAGTDPTVDSNAGTNGKSEVFTTPATGSNSATNPDDPTLDAGLIPDLVSIGDFVWFDTNKDGIQDAGEAPAAGVEVKLLNAAGDEVTTTWTDSYGFYSFTDLTPSTDYQVQFVAPAGQEFTIKGVGSDPTDDSNAGTNGKSEVFTTPATGSNSAILPDDPTLDAGLIPTDTSTDGTGSGNGDVEAPGDTETPGAGTGTGAGTGQPTAPAQGAPATGGTTDAPAQTGAPEVLPNTGGPQLLALLAGLALVASGAAVVLRNRKVAS